MRNFHLQGRTGIAISVALIILCQTNVFFAQARREAPTKSALCTRANALDMIRQQVALTKTFNDSIRRITVLIRAADILWRRALGKARVAFSEAFDLASGIEREIDQKTPRALILRLQVPDQRYVSIRAVARKDPAGAKEVARQRLKPDSK